MKKNLRIVSAAAAALLAVAPVAASAVSVNADPVENIQTTDKSWGIGSLPNNAAVNVSSSLQLNIANPEAGVKQNLTGGVSVNVNGTNYSGLFTPNYSGVEVFGSLTEAKKGGKGYPVTADLKAGTKYYVNMSHVSFNLGKENANKTITVTVPSDSAFKYFGNSSTPDWETTEKITVKADGTFSLGNLILPVDAYDLTNAASVNFFDTVTGQVVTNGSVSLYANAQGKLNTAAVAAEISKKYAAAQVSSDVHTAKAAVVVSPSDVAAGLKKANVPVDANGWFDAPQTFTVDVNAKSQFNGATATLPVTVTVPNGKAAAQPQETTKTVTIMHISTVYDKNGKATTEPALRAYDTYSVVSEPVTINGAKFYKLAGKDQYIKVGNVDGTSRSLKHNSYVYKSSGKRANKKTLKKGSSVTTYGKSFMIAGHQMYRIGKNQYVKKANF